MNKDIVNSLILGDTITELGKLPAKSVDMIFADPPYFMQTDGVLMRTEGTAFKGVNDNWDKFANYQDYDKFSQAWLTEAKRVLKNNGSIFVIGAFQNIYRIGYLMQNLGFWILNDIIWSKSNPVPNFRGTRFTNANETILWCTKSESAKYTFNYKTMKYLNNNKQMRSVWDIAICTGNERLKNSAGDKLHNTQKPEKLLYNCIIAASKLGDLILDPFIGTGTTAVVAKQTGRNYLGIDQEKKYLSAAKKRIKATNVNIDKIAKASLDIKPIPVSMNKLINKGLLKVNQAIYDKKMLHKAIVQDDGSIQAGNLAGSIHKVSAKLLSKINYNGWLYWYIKSNNKLISIDTLREKYRNKYEN